MLINVKFTRAVCKAATISMDVVNTDTFTQVPNFSCTQMTAGLLQDRRDEETGGALGWATAGFK